jgi:TPR repeat protein
MSVYTIWFTGSIFLVWHNFYKGVKQDDFKAVKFYQKACDLNFGDGCSNLGLLYEEGLMRVVVIL